MSVVRSGAYAFQPGSPDDRAQEKYIDRVDVGVFGSLHGVETKLVVPMWYGKSTTYALDIDEETTSLAQAAKLRSGFGPMADPGAVVWWAGPGCDIAYHFEDGYFVLDELVSQVPH